MKIVCVEWIDACIDESHIPPKIAELLKPIKRHNVGFLVSESSGELTICYGILENLNKGEDAYDMTQVIPKGMIEKITEVKP